MKFSDIKQYKIVISLALIFLVCAGSVIIYIAYSQPEELQKPPQQDLLSIPGQSPVPSSTESLHYDYCIIEEMHPDFLDPNATIVHLSSDDLEPFPKYQKQMADESKLSKKWQDGHRFIGDFHDYQRQFSDFRNLTCKQSPDPICNPRKSSLYEYNRRYFTVRCFPDFGSGHQNLPPPRK